MATVASRGSGTPTTTGAVTWASLTNAVDGAVGSNPATYATWTNATNGATGAIDISGHNFSATIGASDTINSVTVNLRHFENNVTRISGITIQPWDGASPIGSPFSCTMATAARNDSTTFVVTATQLRSANFKIRVNCFHGGNTQSGIASIDYVDVTVDYTPPQASVTQAAYQFFDDAGTESGAAALAAQDTAVIGNLANGDGFGCVRIRLQSTTAIAVAATDDFQLQWERNASGSWTNVGTGAVIGYNAPSLTDAAATTNRLTGGTGTFVAGKLSEDGLADDMGWSANNFTEVVYSVKLLAAQFGNGDVLRFRVLYNGAPTQMTYTVTPTVNIRLLIQTPVMYPRIPV